MLGIVSGVKKAIGSGNIGLGEKNESDFTKVKTRSLKDMSCSKCGFIATSKEEYISANHACIPNKRYRCLKCDFKTCHPGSLRNHDLAIHHKDKPVHCCEICGASFSYKTGFNRHLKTHLAKPSKVPCPQCGKLYPNLLCV
ncbi:Zinc finger protein 26like [Caligus rogercresseyi]|uniref:Zinc finger protein 26like n=1 Tax=Caligus rogercresseyi TaxID=217165 RepID=A0A7T8JU51_CALRO|nr:Zinc finger protein 26like [Caligus rogercresseyi]